MEARMSEIAVYQDAVKRLTAENKALRKQLADAVQSHGQEVGLLKAQLNEGLTPELIVLRGELKKWKNRAIVAERRLADIKRRS
jgi:hypothetical protein